MQSFENRISLLNYIYCLKSDKQQRVDNLTFKGIKSLTHFSKNKTDVLIEVDSQHKQVFDTWGKSDAIFHLIENCTNIMVASLAFRCITVIRNREYYDYHDTYGTSTLTHTKFKVDAAISGSIQNVNNNVRYLICPLPGDLVFVCKQKHDHRYHNYNYNQKQSNHQQTIANNNNGYGSVMINGIMMSTSNSSSLGVGKYKPKWGDTKFFTMDQLCQYFHQPTTGAFKKELVNMFTNMNPIKRCFDKEISNSNLNKFCNTSKPKYQNLVVSLGLEKGICHYLSCNCTQCHQCSNQKRKKTVIQQIASNVSSMKPNSGDVINYIRQQASDYFEAKYQIMANKRGKLSVEIVLFCYLGDYIVGLPIRFGKSISKWIISAILVSEMKHNTMLPQLLLGRDEKYRFVWSIWFGRII